MEKGGLNVNRKPTECCSLDWILVEDAMVSDLARRAFVFRVCIPTESERRDDAFLAATCCVVADIQRRSTVFAFSFLFNSTCARFLTCLLAKENKKTLTLLSRPKVSLYFFFQILFSLATTTE